MREIWETVSKAVGFPVEVKDGGLGRSSSEPRTPPSLPVSGQFHLFGGIVFQGLSACRGFSYQIPNSKMEEHRDLQYEVGCGSRSCLTSRKQLCTEVVPVIIVQYILGHHGTPTENSVRRGTPDPPVRN
jgi:hypothetical protein